MSSNPIGLLAAHTTAEEEMDEKEVSISEGMREQSDGGHWLVKCARL